jgi:hypothetical protein
MGQEFGEQPRGVVRRTSWAARQYWSYRLDENLSIALNHTKETDIAPLKPDAGLFFTVGRKHEIVQRE